MSDIQEERREIKAFVNEYNEILLADLEFDDGPDALITREHSTLGIEHTRIFQPKPNKDIIIQQQESIRNDIVRDSEKKFNESYDHPHLNVVLNFEDLYWVNVPSKTFSGNETDQKSKEISEFVNDNIPKAGQTIELQLIRGDKLPSGLLGIKIYRPKDGDHRQWSRHSGGIVPLVNSEHIQKAIDLKNPKVKRYKEKCDEIWLILVINNIKYERSIMYDGQLTKDHYKSNFDKTFLFVIDFGNTFVKELNKATYASGH